MISILIVHELLRVVLLMGEFGKHSILKAYHLTNFLKHVSPLEVGAIGCYNVSITLPKMCNKGCQGSARAIQIG